VSEFQIDIRKIARGAAKRTSRLPRQDPKMTTSLH
jgi:hypothetical protein